MTALKISAYQFSSGIDVILAVFSVPTTSTLPPSGDLQLNDPCNLMTFIWLVSRPCVFGAMAGCMVIVGSEERMLVPTQRGRGVGTSPGRTPPCAPATCSL